MFQRILLITVLILARVLAQDKSLKPVDYLFIGESAKQLHNAPGLLMALKANNKLTERLKDPLIVAFFLPSVKYTPSNYNDGYYVLFPKESYSTADALEITVDEFKALHLLLSSNAAKVHDNAVKVHVAVLAKDENATKIAIEETEKAIKQVPPAEMALARQALGAVLVDTSLPPGAFADLVSQSIRESKANVQMEASLDLTHFIIADNSNAIIAYGGGQIYKTELASISLSTKSAYFSEDEFQNLTTLTEKFRQNDLYIQALKSRMDTSIVDKITKYSGVKQPSLEFRTQIAEEFNKVLTSPDLSQATQFESLKVVQGLRSGANNHIQGPALLWTNRMLLEEAFPKIIPHDVDSAQPLFINGKLYSKAWKRDTLLLFPWDKSSFLSGSDTRKNTIKVYLNTTGSKGKVLDFDTLKNSP